MSTILTGSSTEFDTDEANFSLYCSTEWSVLEPNWEAYGDSDPATPRSSSDFSKFRLLALAFIFLKFSIFSRLFEFYAATLCGLHD